MHRKYLTTAAILTIVAGNCFMITDAKADWSSVVGDVVNVVGGLLQEPGEIAGDLINTAGSLAGDVLQVGGEVAIAGMNDATKVATSVVSTAGQIGGDLASNPVASLAAF